MPKVFEINGFRFFFYSNEGCPLEPCHIHVRKGEKEAKIWIEPSIALDSAWKFCTSEINEIIKLAKQNEGLIRKTWNEFFKLQSK